MTINKRLAGCLLALMFGTGAGLASERNVYYAVNDSTVSRQRQTRIKTTREKPTERMLKATTKRRLTSN